jgi:hypothetical protein
MPFDWLKQILAFRRRASSQSHPKSNSSELATRAPRIKLSAEHQVILELYDRIQRGRTTAFTLANISVSGVAFLSPDFDFSTSIGGVLRGILRLGGQSSPVEFQVIHHTGGVVGARWLSIDPLFKKSLWEFLAPEQAAAECVRTPDDALNSEPDGTLIHYRGLSGNGYFAVHDQGRVVRQQVTLFGLRIYRVTGVRPEFSTLEAKIGETQPGAAAGEYVHFPMMPDDQQKVLAQAARFIRALPDLEKQIQESGAAALGSSPTAF